MPEQDRTLSCRYWYTPDTCFLRVCCLFTHFPGPVPAVKSERNYAEQERNKTRCLKRMNATAWFISLSKNHKPIDLIYSEGYYTEHYTKHYTSSHIRSSCIKDNGFGQDVSRVLYLTVIYLGLMSPPGSCDPPSGRRRAAAFRAHFGLAPDGVYTRDMLPYLPVSSYPHNFTLTTALSVSAVCFCCTFPIVTYAGRYPASLPCGARTFLIYPEDIRDCLSYPNPLLNII